MRLKIHFLTGRPIFRSLDWDINKKELQADFAVIDKRGVQWFVPKGYITDGASIPDALEPLIGDPFAGVTTTGSLVHDKYCDTKEKSQKDTHRIFRELVDFEIKHNPDYGFFRWPWKNKTWHFARSRLMWAAVRVFNRLKHKDWK